MGSADEGREAVAASAGVRRCGRASRLAVVVGGATAAVVLTACGGTGLPGDAAQPVESSAPSAPVWPDPASTVVTTPQGTGTPMTESEREMAATMAEQSGEDLERTLELLQHQDDFALFMEEVRARFGEQFSAAAYASPEGGPAWVAFTGEVPAGAVPVAEALPIPVELRGAALLTDRERQTAQAPGTEAFRADVQSTDGWTASLDPPTARFTFSYVPGGAKEPDEATTAAIVDAARTAIGRDVSFTVEYVPDPLDPGDTEPAVWFLPAGFVADPGASSVEVLVAEQGCASGAGAEGNTAEPVVEVTGTEVRIAVATFVRRGPQACPGHPLAPLVVDIGQPIGERALVDVHGGIDDQYAPPESIYGDITVPPAAPSQG